jgi:hypothetical protein
MLPQAATTAIALPVSDGIGGVKELTSLAVILNAVVISAFDSSVSPSSLAAATPSVCPLVPRAKPRAIGFEILNIFTTLTLSLFQH